MTRKDFAELARIVGQAEARSADSGEVLIALREAIMAFCRTRNNGFDSSKFQEAVCDARNAALKQ